MLTRCRLLLIAACFLVPACPAKIEEPAPAPEPAAPDSTQRAAGFELLGMAVLPTGFPFEETEVGGLSALTYDAERDRFLALSDDRGEHAPARFYSVRLRLDRDAGLLPGGGMEIESVTVLRGRNGKPFIPGTIDPEGLALSPRGTLFLSSEGDTPLGIEPFVREQALDGTFLRAFAVPEHYLPKAGAQRGVRRNLGFEALSVTPDGTRLFAGTENALLQDGAGSSVEEGSPSRFVVFDVASGESIAEYQYLTDPVVRPPAEPDGFHTNGLVEALALDSENLLTLERSYSAGYGVGAGNSIRLFHAHLAGADNLLGRATVDGQATVRPIAKELLLDLETLGLILDNVEGMTFGPPLADGRSTLILVSDNNFNTEQLTQWIALAFEPSLLGVGLGGVEVGNL